jgi:hypothetical protein
MAVAVQAVGAVPFDAPLPQPRTDDLLAVTPPVDLSADRWLRGIWSAGTVPGPAFTHDPCSTGSERAKIGPGPIATQVSGLFNVYLPASCTAQSVGPDPEWFIGKLEAMFLVYERAAVERALATGDGHTDLGSYLGDENMQALSMDTVDPVTALRLLETAIARHSSGIIHAAPSTVVAWDSLHLTTCGDDGLTYTRRGTPVAVGPGYIDAVPDNADQLLTNEQWAFASGPLEIRRGSNIDVPASAYAEILDRSMNDVLVIAERPYVFNWVARQDPHDSDHTQAGVLIDESRIGCCAVDGGSP